MSAVCEKTLWDSCGNSARVEMFCIGQGVFELFLTDFNNSIPRRFVGAIGELNNRADIFIASKKEAGFIEQLPSFNPDAWRA